MCHVHTLLHKLHYACSKHHQPYGTGTRVNIGRSTQAGGLRTPCTHVSPLPNGNFTFTAWRIAWPCVLDRSSSQEEQQIREGAGQRPLINGDFSISSWACHSLARTCSIEGSLPRRYGEDPVGPCAQDSSGATLQDNLGCNANL
jgi:hypothetical protein